MSVLALIPARSGSKGIPGKNLRTLGGKTLIGIAADAAWGACSGEGYYVHLSTDINDPALRRDFDSAIRRPSELAQDDTPMIDVVKHALAQIPGPDDQIIVLLQPTQPFRTPEHVKAAIALLQETQADSVVSVVELPQTHSPEMVCSIRNGCLEPWQHPEWGNSWSDVPTRRQDVRPMYRRDGTVYAFWRKTVSQHGTLYGQDVRPLIIPPDESCELDTEQDWLDVERRWQERHAAHR